MPPIASPLISSGSCADHATADLACLDQSNAALFAGKRKRGSSIRPVTTHPRDPRSADGSRARCADLGPDLGELQTSVLMLRARRQRSDPAIPPTWPLFATARAIARRCQTAPRPPATPAAALIRFVPRTPCRGRGPGKGPRGTLLRCGDRRECETSQRGGAASQIPGVWHGGHGRCCLRHQGRAAPHRLAGEGRAIVTHRLLIHGRPVSPPRPSSGIRRRSSTGGWRSR